MQFREGLRKGMGRGFGDIGGPKPCKFIGFGDIRGPKPYKFTERPELVDLRPLAGQTWPQEVLESTLAEGKLDLHRF